MLETEARDPAAANLDELPSAEVLALFQRANEEAAAAVGEALPAILRAMEAAASALASGGRILYVGTGSSGRLAVVDASECPPTFGVSDGTVVALIAGGRDAMFKADPGFEDSAEAGRSDMEGLRPGPRDFVLGISAAGGAAYVVGALEAARRSGARTASLSSNPDSPISRVADMEIVTRTGAEPIAGSTRMKAGTAQKMVLNMISTGAMVKTGKVRGNLMVNLKPSNAKLRSRMVGIVAELAKTTREEAVSLLKAHEWSIPAVLDDLGGAAGR